MPLLLLLQPPKRSASAADREEAMEVVME